ncbi:DUF1830 domain-containing protein [Chroococcidiopsis sp. CCNUC1]|uniref:DUF1830 domain-containing protein n=1 Tax=Chroococcidiopsis sp. CCNUC1 TaxID=2653189 RepID=UPI002020D1AB|nr:DUF1830 domain-containing protein [Chroococcidiopsis sp. CCNUC1]URD53721.1 DUF1830 domain-containing protein [Chroococcidiopsis sp. CCNUC1]
MTQIVDSLPDEYPERILCNYKNATNTIQIARITNIPHWYLERIVFPGQHLLFEAVKDAQLEIHSAKVASAIPADTIDCQRLQVSMGEENN